MAKQKKIYGANGNIEKLKAQEEKRKEREAKKLQKSEEESKPKRQYTKSKTVDEIINQVPLADIKKEANELLFENPDDKLQEQIEESEIIGNKALESNNIIDEIDTVKYFKDSLKASKAKKKKAGPFTNWDVKIGDPIPYFDPELSYELTGYRPITETKGLDFDPDDFRKDAITKEKTGRYTTYQVGGRAYRDWWLERQNRCINGYTYNGYTLTGDHYFFLNFYSLPINKKVEGSELSDIDLGFPSFIKEQYVYFHYVKMAEMIGKDICALKSRGVKVLPSYKVIYR